jgi:perosamine synthetase
MIPICKIDIQPEDVEAVVNVLESGWIVQGREVADFENQVATHCGVPYGIATSSCTSALHLVLKALGLGPGDEVIVPAFTWIATANAVEHCGATPIFCDIRLDTFNIDTEQVASLITDRTVGLLPVHLFGLFAEIEALRRIADRHKLWLVEDAACALGSRCHRWSPGELSDAACFSFHPRKSITTGEGGMIVTRRDEIARKCRSLRCHGMMEPSVQGQPAQAEFLLPDFDDFGFNYRMTDLQGALGKSQMSRLDRLLQSRRRSASIYDELLAGNQWLRGPVEPEGMLHSYQSYVCLFAPQDPDSTNFDRFGQRRNQIMQHLQNHQIMTRQGTHAPALLECYRNKYNIQPEQFPNAHRADSLSLALPLFPGISRQDQARVVHELRASCQQQADPLKSEYQST